MGYMGIRKANMNDRDGIISLLDQLEYPGTEKFLTARLQQLIHHPDESLLIYEKEGKILAFISFHFIPQLATEGDFARISYFSVDEEARGMGIGSQMEAYCSALAMERGCDRMEVHCHTRRAVAHQFYFRQGYEESPKYLIKSIPRDH